MAAQPIKSSSGRFFTAGLVTGALGAAAGPHLARWLGKRALKRLQRSLPERIQARLAARNKRTSETPRSIGNDSLSASKALPNVLPSVQASAPSSVDSNIAAASQSAVAATSSAPAVLPVKDVATGAGAALKAASGALKGASAAAKSASTSLAEKAATVSTLASSSRGRRVLKLAAVGLTASAVAAGVLQFRKHYHAARKEKADDQRGAQPAPAASPQPADNSASGPAVAPAPATPAVCPVAPAAAAAGEKSTTSEKPRPLTFVQPPASSQPAANSGAGQPGRLEDQIGAALNLAFARLGLNLRATAKAD